MAVIANLNTKQTPITAGSTGTQVIKFIQAPRVYVKAIDVTATPVVVKSNGSLPSGWTDLGIVNGNATVTYDKEIKEIRTGIDQILRASYIQSRTSRIEASLSQVDDTMLAAVTGLTLSTISAGSIYQLAIGKEDIVQKALLLVVQNKLDGKEIQFYSPNADITFSYEESGEELLVKLAADLKAFTFGSDELQFVQTQFA